MACQLPYLYSVGVTFDGGGEVFYEAAMLITFVLFGHWMEMRSRRGTTDALRALLTLVPERALRPYPETEST